MKAFFSSFAVTFISLLVLASKVLANHQTVLEIATGDKRFGTLVDLLTAADLVDDLSGDGPFSTCSFLCGAIVI